MSIEKANACRKSCPKAMALIFPLAGVSRVVPKTNFVVDCCPHHWFGPADLLAGPRIVVTAKEWREKITMPYA